MAIPTKVGIETIDGADFDLFLNSAGEFLVNFDGDEIKADSKKRLLDKLRTQIRTHKRVNVPATLIERQGYDSKPPKIIDIALTGMHAGSRNVLYREEKSGETGQDAGYSGTMMRRLTKEEQTAYLTLWKASKAAEAALERWVKERSIVPRDEVSRAMQNVLDGVPAKA